MFDLDIFWKLAARNRRGGGQSRLGRLGGKSELFELGNDGFVAGMLLQKLAQRIAGVLVEAQRDVLIDFCELRSHWARRRREQGRARRRARLEDGLFRRRGNFRDNIFRLFDERLVDRGNINLDVVDRRYI